MRSLRSARKVIANKQDENAITKMCMNPNKSVKSRRNKRQVLADKTNSGSDLNQTSSSPEMAAKDQNDSRPKRQIQVPTRFIDHDLSPVGLSRKLTPKCASTPLSTRRLKSALLSTKSVNKAPKNSKELSPKKITGLSPKILSPKRTRTRRGAKEGVVEEAKKSSNVKTDLFNVNKNSSKVKSVSVEQNKVSDEQILSKVKSVSVEQNSSKQRKTLEEQNSSKVKSVSFEQNSSRSKPTKTTNNNIKMQTPVYRKISLLEKPSIAEPERLALYEFEVDSKEEPKTKKKKTAVKKAAPRKKKNPKLAIDDDAAMKVLVEQLKKIQAVAALKKLKKNVASKNVKVEIPTLRTVLIPPKVTQNKAVSERRTSFSSPPPSPIRNDEEDAVFSCPAQPRTSEAVTLSSFCDVPIASSSMIQNLEPKPSASPWRVNYDNETKKWPYSFAVKPSMTPSYQRDTFHVMGLDDATHRQADHVAQQETTEKQAEINKNWRQTSILSFYEESFKKSLPKKSHSSKKYFSQFNLDELIAKNRSMDESTSSQESPETSAEKVPSENDVNKLPSENNDKMPCENDRNKLPLDESDTTPSEDDSNKLPLNKNDKLRSGNDNNKSNIDDCFGFDDSAYDQENINPISPSKIKNINMIRRGGKQRKGRELKEINPPAVGPARVSTTDLINVLASHKKAIFEDLPMEDVTMKDPEKEVVVNNDDSSNEEVQNDGIPESCDVVSAATTKNDVALFEDPVEPQLVHFSKPTRKSYERKKRPAVKFANTLSTLADAQSSDADSDDEDYEESVNEAKKRSKRSKKKRKPNIKTIREEKEAEQWAASFNSMLEEVDDFALCIE